MVCEDLLSVTCFCAPDYLVFLPCFWIFVWDSLNCTWIFIVWEWRKTVPLMLRRRGHFTTSGVHYFSNNFNGLESQPCIKTLFRWFISRHLSCFHPEISWVLNSFLTHLINLTLQFPKRHFRANNRGLSHWYVGYRSYYRDREIKHMWIPASQQCSASLLIANL